MASSIELYETLRDKIGEDAARMVAETIPQTEYLATKADIESVRTEIHKTVLSAVKWILGFVIPMQLATWAAIVGLYFKH